jgi:hypothetical protein
MTDGASLPQLLTDGASLPRPLTDGASFPQLLTDGASLLQLLTDGASLDEHEGDAAVRVPAWPTDRTGGDDGHDGPLAPRHRDRRRQVRFLGEVSRQLLPGSSLELTLE